MSGEWIICPGCLKQRWGSKYEKPGCSKCLADHYAKLNKDRREKEKRAENTKKNREQFINDLEKDLNKQGLSVCKGYYKDSPKSIYPIKIDCLSWNGDTLNYFTKPIQQDICDNCQNKKKRDLLEKENKEAMEEILRLDQKIISQEISELILIYWKKSKF